MHCIAERFILFFFNKDNFSAYNSGLGNLCKGWADVHSQCRDVYEWCIYMQYHLL